MPVGTYGTVKGMLPRDIEDIGAQIILGNTFHLWLRPGTEEIQRHGDLHDLRALGPAQRQLHGALGDVMVGRVRRAFVEDHRRKR